MKAIDLGNYSAVPTQEQVRCILDAGYTKAIVGTSFGSVWQAQITAFEQGGMDVDEYQFVGHMRATHRRVWLDCELAEENDTIRDCIRGANPYGIYTRRGWWVDATGDWDIKAEFPWLKLWDASYGDPPPAFVPYGGFTEREIHQWHDSTNLCGLNVDLNIIEQEARMYDDQTIDVKFLKAIAFLQGQMKDDRNELAAAIAELAQANATSFKGIEDRLTALEAK